MTSPKHDRHLSILIGEADETNPVEQCREMVAHARPDGAPIALTVYPGVHHNFDVALLTPGARFRGYGSNTTSRRPRTRKKRRAHSSPLILPKLLPTSRPQSEKSPMWATRLLIAALAGYWRSRSRNKSEITSKGFIRPLSLDPTQGWLSPDRHFRRQNPQGCQAGRSAGRPNLKEAKVLLDELA